MGARIAGGFGQLGHDVRGRWQVGIAHAEIDHILSGGARTRLHGVYFRKHIGRQPFQPVKFRIVHRVLP